MKSLKFLITFLAVLCIVVSLSVYIYIFHKDKVIVFLGLPQQKQIAKVKVGVIAPLSEDTAIYGFSIKHGIELARQELSADNIELLYKDTKCNPERAAEKMQELVDAGVVAVIGETCSGATLAAAPIANQNKIVLISPASTSPRVTTEGGDYVFRTIQSDQYQGSFAARLIFSKGYRRLVIAYSDEPYGQGFRDVLKESFENLGGTVVTTFPITKSAGSYDIEIASIKKVNPDAIFIVSNAPVVSGAFLLSLYDAKVKVPLFGAEGLRGNTFVQDLGDKIEGLTAVSTTIGTDIFIQRYRAEFGSNPDAYGAQAYDAFKAIYLVLNDSSELDRTSYSNFKDVLQNITFSGASGVIKFDANGDVFGNYDVYVVKDGTFLLEK